MTDWFYFDKFYKELTEQDVYEQPDEAGRTEISRGIISSAPIGGLTNVLDVGCGSCYAQDLFVGFEYIGITASYAEHERARANGKVVFYMDYNFIRLGREFDLIFASHALEHSPAPILTLMEWHRVAKNLLLVVPNPEHYGYIGKNHYSVAPPQQVRWWLRRAGWRMTWKKITETDIAYFAVKEPRIGSEGWANMDHAVYAADRDNVTVEEAREEERGRK